jgi:hypothetical protein
MAGKTPEDIRQKFGILNDWRAVAQPEVPAKKKNKKEKLRD